MTRQRKPGPFLLGALLSICIVLLAANFWRLNQPPRPDPRIVGLAVRATVFAIPTPTPRIVEVTRVVEVTAMPPTATATLTPTITPQPGEGTGGAGGVQPAAALPDAAVPLAKSGGDEAAPLVAVAAEEMAAGEVAAEAIAATGEKAFAEQEAAGAPDGELSPAPGEEGAEEPPAEPAPDTATDTTADTVIDTGPGPCAGVSNTLFTTVPVDGGGLSHPDALHADLNLAVRGYSPTDAPADLVNKDGPVDADPPQLAGIFGDFRRPPFGQAYRVNDWNWNCGDHGCALGPLDHVPATLLTLVANPGEPLGIPHRGAQVYGGGYKALVLYAEPTRITLGYTREDSVANGYAVQFENICVDPNLLALYQSSNAAGRGFLPALREDEVLGTAGSGAVLIAVRDRGVFFDPRSRLDWWHGF